MKKMNKKAFTLIELLVVVAIVGILVLLGMPRFIGHTERAKLTRIQHDVRVMEQEVGTVFVSNGDEFNSWEDSSKGLNQLAQDNKLFDREGPAAKNGEPIDGSYKAIPEKYKDKINTKLKGTFYANSGGKVYYEHVKPLFEKSTEPENPAEPEGSDGSEGKDLVCSYNKEGLMNPIKSREPIKGETAIDSADELVKIGEEYPLDGDYILTSDIDLSGINWEPIGSFTNTTTKSPFTGTFDGNGYKIINLTIDLPSKSSVGLFGHTERAIISNVALEDINVTGNSRVGGLVGSAHSGSKISNSYSTGSVKGIGRAGGLVGDADSGAEINNSYSTSSVELTGTQRSNAGGLVGRANNSTTISNSSATGSVAGRTGLGGLVGGFANSTIENSCASGTVRGTRYINGTKIHQSEDAGGLVGWFSSGTATNSYATGEVYGENSVGGFVGGTNYDAIIRKSYATGPVKGTWHAGGFVGKAIGGTYENSYATGSVTGDIGGNGGFVGWAEYRTKISNSYSTGSVTAGEKTWSSQGGSVGGFVGYVSGAEFPINNSYWDTEITGQEESTGYYQYSSGSSSRYYDYLDGVKGKTTDEMKLEESYEGWDFETIWKIDEGNDYPKLRKSTGPENPAKPGEEPGYSDEEIQDLRDKGYIPIATAEELDKIRKSYELEHPLDGKYILIANINLSNIDNWTPIGNSNSKFTGSFDGNGYNITGLTINSGSNYVGLFGYTSGAIISNVALKDINVTGANMVGGLVGYATLESKISNSYVTGEVSGLAYVGGLVGYANNRTTISSSYVTGSVSKISSATAGKWIGGLVGSANNSTIENSYTTGPVKGTGSENEVGGLVGRIDKNNTIINSYATGEVTGKVLGRDIYVGGLVGWAGDEGNTVTNSYWNTETTGRPTSRGGTAKSTEEMMKQTTYEGWDFDTIWKIDEGYPTLR